MIGPPASPTCPHRKKIAVAVAVRPAAAELAECITPCG